MAPRPAPPPLGGRVRRVSLLIDIGGSSVEDYDRVRLLVRRLLSHFSRQRPAPRWCVRFYDSCLSPHAFDAKLRARADERAARRAEEEERERERNATDSRVHSWVDEHTRETAGVGSLRVASGKDAGARLGGASEAARATRHRDFGACNADAAEAFLRHHDEAFALYHGDSTRAQTKTARTETADVTRGTARRAAATETADEKNRRADESSWFTTLARQIAATLQESGGTHGHTDERGWMDGSKADDAHGLMLVLARVGVAAGTTAPEMTETAARKRGPNAIAPVALAAAAEEKRRENVARAFGGIEAALREERTVAHLLRLPFEDDDARFEADAAEEKVSSRAAALDAPGGGADVSTASDPSGDRNANAKRSREGASNAMGLRALRVATRSAWRRATALFSGFGGCALPAALVSHAAAHLAPCALMAASADAAARALGESERFGASSAVLGESEFSALALALTHGDDEATGGVEDDAEHRYETARVRVFEGALETETARFGDPSAGTRKRTTTRSRRRAAEKKKRKRSVSSEARRGATVGLGDAALVRGDELPALPSPRGAPPRGGVVSSPFREGSRSTTVTIEALVALDDERESTTFGDVRRHSPTSDFGDEESLVLVPRAKDDALGSLAALLALRGVAAVAEVAERTASRESATCDATATKRSKDDASADEEELDVMATQEEAEPKPEETGVVVNRRVAVVRPLFARALSLRFVDGPRMKSPSRAFGAGDSSEREGKLTRFCSAAGEAARALAAASRLSAAEWGCVESAAEGAGDDDALGTRPAAPLGDHSAERRDDLAARPFAFASSPEYKPFPSAGPGIPALPWGTDAGARKTGEANDRAADDAVSGGGETRVARLSSPESSLAEAFVEAANAAPAGTHRWEPWYGDGPGVGANVAERLMTIRASARECGSPQVDPRDATFLAPLRLPAPAAEDADAERRDRAAPPKESADAALAARFEAMVKGLPAPANALGAPVSPSGSRDEEAGDSDSASASVGLRTNGDGAPLRGGSEENGASDERRAGFPTTRGFPAEGDRRENVDSTPKGGALALALVPAAAAAAAAACDGNAPQTKYALAAIPCSDFDAATRGVAAAYASARSACFAAPAEAPDPDVGEVAAALAAKTVVAFEEALRPRWLVQNEPGETSLKRRAHDVATRALFKTAKDLRAAHSGVAGAAAKAAKRREHLLQAHLRFACAALAPARLPPSATAKLAKTVARLVGAVTFLLTPVGAEGVRRFVDRELAPRYSGEKSAALLAAARAELGVADPAGPQAPQGGGGGGGAVFSPTAPDPRPRGRAPDPSRGEAGEAAVREGPATRAARLGIPPRDKQSEKIAAAKPPGAEGWHPVFRSRATRTHRRVAMPDPARAAAGRAREAAREAERRARDRAAAAAALIERDGAFGRNRSADRRRGGKRAARLDPDPSRASADRLQLGAMPAPRRLAVEFGSGNDARETASASYAYRPPSSDPAARDGARRRASGGQKAFLFSASGGLETPARDVQSQKGGAAEPHARGGRSVGGGFGSTWLPLGGGLETPAAARTRVAATPVAATRAAGAGDRRTPRKTLPGSATNAAAATFSPAAGAASTRREHQTHRSREPLGAAPVLVAETPAAAVRSSRGAAGDGKNLSLKKRSAEARRAPAKRRAGPVASFGAMVREGRELAETERGGGKRTRR